MPPACGRQRWHGSPGQPRGVGDGQRTLRVERCLQLDRKLAALVGSENLLIVEDKFGSWHLSTAVRVLDREVGPAVTATRVASAKAHSGGRRSDHAVFQTPTPTLLGIGRPRSVPKPVTATTAVAATTAVVDCAVYCGGTRVPGTLNHAESLAKVRELQARGEQAFVWIGLHEPDEGQMYSIAKVFGHPLAVEDAVHAHQRPKVDRYDDSLFMVLKTVNYVPHESVELAREIGGDRRDHGVRRSGLRHHGPPW